ncbi:MAG: PHB depolymerase [Bdellovibrio sp.]|nr:PHB depolymerase [Bdellovibrio sp.]
MLKHLVLLLSFSTFVAVHASQAPQAPKEQQPTPASPPLGSWNIDKSAVSISGVSSGAFMAVQMGVAYSREFMAVASVAGGIYWCSEGDPQRAKSVCMGKPQEVDSQVQIAKARDLASQQSIDPVGALSRQNIYIFASPKDSVIHPANSEKLSEFYGAFIAPTKIKIETSLESAHGFPTLNSGISCGMGFLPWILKCNFDLAGEILQSAYGTLQPRGDFIPQHLMKYSQAEFGDEKTPLFKDAWVYVPETCAQGARCRLHVALHGCQMNPDFIQDKFATIAGYNEWAETNGIVVLYPQSAKIPKDNPYACWDWFGFTGPDYMTKSGTQMSALKKMIEKVIR